jgi:hypothetical protein
MLSSLTEAPRTVVIAVSLLLLLVGGNVLAATDDAVVFPPDRLATPLKRIYISSESVLSGIRVPKDSFQQVLKKLGKPSRTEMSSPRSEWGRTVVTGTYEWEGQAATLKLTTLQMDRVEPEITRIEVWGSRPDGEIGTTGRGLKLGDTIADARRVYGLKLYFGVTLSEKDNPCGSSLNRTSFPGYFSFTLDFDKEERVKHMAFALDNRCPSY